MQPAPKSGGRQQEPQNFGEFRDLDILQYPPLDPYDHRYRAVSQLGSLINGKMQQLIALLFLLLAGCRLSRAQPSNRILVISEDKEERQSYSRFWDELQRKLEKSYSAVRLQR